MDDQPSALLRAVRAAGLLADPVEEEGVVRGPARFVAAGYDVSVNLDPDPDLDVGADEEDADPRDPASLIAEAEAFLSMSAGRWTSLVREIVDVIDEEIGQVDGRPVTLEDLTLAWVAVVPGAYLLSFPVPHGSPEVHIRVQLGSDLELDELSVDEDEDEDEAIEFDSLEALLDHLDGEGT